MHVVPNCETRQYAIFTILFVGWHYNFFGEPPRIPIETSTVETFCKTLHRLTFWLEPSNGKTF